MVIMASSQSGSYRERSRTICAPSTKPGMSAITRAAPPSARVPPTSHTPSSRGNEMEEIEEKIEMWKDGRRRDMEEAGDRGRKRKM